MSVHGGGLSGPDGSAVKSTRLTQSPIANCELLRCTVFSFSNRVVNKRPASPQRVWRALPPDAFAGLPTNQECSLSMHYFVNIGGGEAGSGAFGDSTNVSHTL
jgi:hypothetical protein